MTSLPNLAPAAACLLLGACATGPQLDTRVSGALPVGQSYAAVQPARDTRPLPAWARLEPCLQGAGLKPGTPPQILAQVAYVLRPARAMVLQPGDAQPRKARRPARGRDTEELVLTLTDRASGAVLWRGAAARLLGKHEGAGDGSALVGPLCARLTAPPGPGPGPG